MDYKKTLKVMLITIIAMVVWIGGIILISRYG